jgi:hypothetical protein
MKAIIIKNIHPGRFGNKLLHYHNAYQLSKKYDCPLYVGNNDNFKFFNGIIYIEDNNYNYGGDVLELDACLGELFFDHEYDSKNMISFKSEYDYNEVSDFTEIGVHFRGTDFHKWNPVAVLSEEYYLNSIKYCMDNYTNCKFNLFTDDETLESYKNTINYLSNNNLEYMLGEFDKHFIYDFSRLSNCDVIISTPSTFSICAGFLRKRKDIIHSKEWIKSRIEKNDKFWVDLYNGGNKNYKIKKLI